MESHHEIDNVAVAVSVKLVFVSLSVNLLTFKATGGLWEFNGTIFRDTISLNTEIYQPSTFIVFYFGLFIALLHAFLPHKFYLQNLSNDLSKSIITLLSPVDCF